jgi:23S rRNA maturation-related 3'-5' exoribonuclease YhaM
MDLATVKSLDDGSIVSLQCCEIAALSVNPYSKGEFLRAVLRDEEGESCELVYWDYKAKIKKHAALKASVGKCLDGARVEKRTYKDNPQLTLMSWKGVKRSRRQERLEEIFQDNVPLLTNAVTSHVTNPDLREACLALLEDDRYLDCPAAPLGCQGHDDEIHGLVRHMTGMLSLVEAFTKTEKDLDMEVLVAGIIFHDCGKMFAYTSDFTEKNTPGRLLDHPDLGLMYFAEKCSKVKKEDPLLFYQVAHIIISHHGEFSAVKPQTREAQLVASVDSAESRTALWRQLSERSQFDDRGWTSYEKYAGGRIFSTRMRK